MSDHDCERPQPTAETLQVYDFIGIGLATIGNVIGAIGHGVGMMATEFFSAARLRRHRQEDQRARREAGYELERILGQPLSLIEEERDVRDD